MTDEKNKLDPLKPFFKEADEIEKKIIKDVLDLEKDRLSQTQPRLNSEIIDIIKRHVK